MKIPRRIRNMELRFKRNEKTFVSVMEYLRYLQLEINCEWNSFMLVTAEENTNINQRLQLMQLKVFGFTHLPEEANKYDNMIDYLIIKGLISEHGIVDINRKVIAYA